MMRAVLRQCVCGLCPLLAVDMLLAARTSPWLLLMSVNKWAPASGSDTRNAHTAHCFDRCNHFFFPACLCVLLWMAPCLTFQSILKGYYVIMSLFHFPEMRKNVSLSIYWLKVSVIFSVLTFISSFYLGYFSQKSNKVNLLHDSQKCFSNYNIIICVSLVRQWHHYQEYQWPSPEPSALIMRKCLLRAPIVADKVIISRHLSYIISQYVGKIEMFLPDGLLTNKCANDIYFIYYWVC